MSVENPIAAPQTTAETQANHETEFSARKMQAVEAAAPYAGQLVANRTEVPHAAA